MKIALVTTLPDLIENTRIKEEVEALGHSFEMVNLSNFNFSVENGTLDVPGLTNLTADIIILRGIFNSLKPIAAVVEKLKQQGTKVFDNNFLEHRYSIDKITDLLKVSLAGILVPDTAYGRDFAEFGKLAKKMGYPVVVKSTRMGKGASVFKIDNEADLLNLVAGLRQAGKEAKSYLLQKYIPYKFDLRCLVIGDRVYVMRRIPSAGEFRANFSLGGSVELFDLDEEGKRLAVKALATVNMSVGGVDILIDEEDKRFILEVNHTAGFVGMEKATGENIGKIFVEHAISSAK